MNVIIHLSKSDIAAIIAEKHGVPLSRVAVTTEKSFTGYGPSEREIATPVAYVDITKKSVFIQEGDEA